jgi:hypothetical protein
MRAKIPRVRSLVLLVVMSAIYHDTLVRDHSKWKFKRRVVAGDIPAPKP